MTPHPFTSEREEIAKIDYLLTHLARAVECGEVHIASYELMAPRYLERRAELVAMVTGADRDVIRAAPAATTVAAPRSGRPVRWTTVLTFLGALLVIAAAAIFAVVVWDVIGVLGKLTFMGLLTCAFYAAGWYAHRASLKAGAVALTAVASTMLLFDGWILIDGYDLQGPVPWAIVLLVCSAAYWATELVLAERFFGVVGAAAQMGWWWLLGAGLGWPVPARLAGMAVVAVAWQLAGERGRSHRALGPLSSVLEWAAPITGTVLSAALVFDLVQIRSASLAEVLAAAVVCACASVVIGRTRLLAHESARWLTAAAQLPLVAFVLSAWESTGAVWGLVAIAALMALGYDLVALVSAGLPFAVLGMASELVVVVMACDVLDARPHVAVGAAAALAVLWALGARIAEDPTTTEGVWRGVDEVREVADAGSLLLLAGVSVASITVAEGIALAGFSLQRDDAVLVFFVLAAWWMTAAVRKHGAFAFGASVWSFYALAALMSWLLPGQRAELYALGLVALGGAWIAMAGPLSARYGLIWREIMRAAGTGAVVVFSLGGLMLGVYHGWDASWWPCGLEAATVAVFAIDALIVGSRLSAGLAGAFAVLATALAGLILGDGEPTAEAAQWWALASASSSAVIAGTMAALGAKARRLAVPCALASVGTATVLVLPTLDQHGLMQASLAMLAVAWAFAAFLTSQWLMVGSGLSAFGVAVAFVAYGGHEPFVTTVVPGVAGLILGSFALTRPGGPGGRLAVSGRALAIAGLTGQAAMVGLGFMASAMGVDVWFGLGQWGLSGALALFGVHLAVQSARWSIEPGLYLGGFALVVSMWFALLASETFVAEAYSTPLAVYVVVCAYQSVRQRPGRAFPVVLDALAVGVGLGYPLMLGLTGPASEAAGHALWVLGLSLVAIAGGVGAKSRWYFFGGVGALAAIAVYRSFVVLAEFWWVLLGIVGVAMLVIALTWERQRLLVSETRDRLKSSFDGWR